MFDLNKAKLFSKDISKIACLAKNVNEVYYDNLGLKYSDATSIIMQYKDRAAKIFAHDEQYFTTENYSFLLSEKDFFDCSSDKPYKDRSVTVHGMFNLALLGCLLVKMSEDYGFEIPQGSKLWNFPCEFYDYDSIRSYG